MMSSVAGQPWRDWYRRAFPAYLLFLFCATHFPRLELGGTRSSDKIAHTLAFGLLAFFYWRFCESFWPQLSAQFAPRSALLLAGYCIFDEVSQSWVGRSSDLADLLFDLVGVAAVLSVLELRRRRLAEQRI